MSVVVAAFDVDETLTVRDCVLPFMRRVAGLPIMIRTSVRALPLLVRRDRDAVKAMFVEAVFANALTSEIESHGIAFADKVAGNWIRQDVASRMRWHQDQGHVVVLVSASLSPYLMPLGDMLEVDAVLCTELQMIDSSYSGAIDGLNCRGPEKAVRLRAWLVEAGIDESALEYAYGDSSGDTELLAMATNAVWVNKVVLEAVPS